MERNIKNKDNGTNYKKIRTRIEGKQRILIRARM